MDKALKQRLVGASVLVALAVVVLPMLLTGPSDGQPESRRIELPDRPPELSIETRRFPIGDQDGSQPSVLERPESARSGLEPATEREPAPAAQDAQSEAAEDGGPAAAALAAETQASPEQPSSGETDVAEQPEDPPAASARAEPEPVPAQPDVSGGRYVVQVASFSRTGNVDSLVEQLEESSLPVLLDTVESTSGLLHRVRVGPYQTRAEADGVIARLNNRLPDLRPRVTDLRPDESAAVSEPTDPLIRWVVQVGVFSKSENAENLVFTLRDAGYRASSEAVTRAGSTSWRVRVGPVIQRRDAVQIAESIQRDLGHDGLVMSAD